MCKQILSIVFTVFRIPSPKVASFKYFHIHVRRRAYTMGQGFSLIIIFTHRFWMVVFWIIFTLSYFIWTPIFFYFFSLLLLMSKSHLFIETQDLVVYVHNGLSLSGHTLLQTKNTLMGMKIIVFRICISLQLNSPNKKDIVNGNCKPLSE